MLHVQRFALDNIYCAPGQDRQFSFKMARTHRASTPPRGSAAIYAVNKHLPTKNGRYQVFTIGNIPAELLNLLSQKQFWLRDTWIRVSDDMVLRNYILKVYNADGLMYPRDMIYYSFINESSLMVALEVSDGIKTQFPVESFIYLNVYSNAYFQTVEFNAASPSIGIDHRSVLVNNNLDKVQLQGYVASMKANGGDVFVYVNGYYVPEVTLSIPDGSTVEIVYDQSVLSREYHAISGLRTFNSTLDQRGKYLLPRPKTRDHIQYQDDVELYIHHTDAIVKRGVYFYKHKSHVMRNVTDKDYSLNAQYINTTCLRLGELTQPGMQSKQLVLYTRKSGRDMPLVFSSLKLHELYKLPDALQLDIINNTGPSIDLFRVEKLEASEYFQIARVSKMYYVNPQAATRALGYAAITHYFADTPQHSTSQLVTVPELYQWGSTAFEYDSSGRYTGHYPTNGPVYQKTAAATSHVEFMKGVVASNQGSLYPEEGSITVDDPSEEVWLVAAYFDGAVRQSPWEDISANVTTSGKVVSWKEPSGRKIKVVRSNRLNIYDEEIDLTDGALYFPICSMEDRGNGMMRHICDLPYLDISLYLNDNYLTEGIDCLLDYPYVCIFSKKYIDYSSPTQKLHIRCSGFTLDKSKINHLNVKGFVNNGVLTRNNYYDLRDDRVYSAFVDGKLYNRALLRFSEEDNTVRLGHPLNGMPYTLRENFIPVRFITGENTLPLYHSNAAANAKISALFNQTYPEPAIDEFNVIGHPHYLFSPVVSKLINDILTGVIAEQLYSTPYNDTTILDLLDSRYKELLKLDPVKSTFPSGLVEIHPHLGNEVISLNLLQYRFVHNTIRLLTNNRPDRINLSGYLTIST